MTHTILTAYSVVQYPVAVSSRRGGVLLTCLQYQLLSRELGSIRSNTEHREISVEYTVSVRSTKKYLEYIFPKKVLPAALRVVRAGQFVHCCVLSIFVQHIELKSIATLVVITNNAAWNQIGTTVRTNDLSTRKPSDIVYVGRHKIHRY